MERTFELGKIDYNGSGRRNCMATLSIRWDGKRFRVCGGIWNPRRTDCYACGQNVDEVAGYFPEDAKAQEILALWRDWHLNDMRAGSPAQEAYLQEHPITERLDRYGAACASLEAAGLNPDPEYLHNGKPYRYGSAWLTREVPPDVVARIEALLLS